jgi:hypothetical protein
VEARVHRISSRALLTFLAGAGALALAAAPAAHAAAGDDATIQTSDLTLSFNNEGGSTASCPTGQTATGGGLGTVTPPPVNVAINVSAATNKTELPGLTRSGDKARTWYSFAYSGSGSTEDMKVLAICSASAGGRLRVATFSVPPSKTKAKTVSCPKGQRALGGGLGLATQPVSGTYEEGSGPLAKGKGVGGTTTGDVPRAWRVAAYNGFSATRQFQAMVICSKTAKPRIVASAAPVATNTDVELNSQCPAGQVATGGGPLALGKPTVELEFAQSTPLSAAGTVAGTLDGSTPVSWDGDVYNRSAQTRTYKLFAVCV